MPSEPSPDALFIPITHRVNANMAAYRSRMTAHQCAAGLGRSCRHESIPRRPPAPHTAYEIDFLRRIGMIPTR